MRKLEVAIYGLIAILIALGVYLSHWQEEFFLERYIVEDGPLEWGTFVMLTLSGFLMLGRAWRLRQGRSRIFLGVTVLAGLVLLFGAGEEISWGQRVFGIETPEFLAEHNRQRETNLHNLEVYGLNLNKLIFSNLLGVFLVVYLLVLPRVATRHEAVEKLTTRWGIPLPTGRQVVVWILAMALPAVIVTTHKRDEVREACAGLIVFATLMYPRNRWIYDADREI